MTDFTNEELTEALKAYIKAVVSAESVDFIDFMREGRSRDIVEYLAKDVSGTS